MKNIRIFKFVFLIICFMFVFNASMAQVAMDETVNNEVVPIDSLVRQNVSEVTNAILFFLTTEDKMNRRDGAQVYGNYLSEKFDYKISLKAFMCSDHDDDMFAIYPTGKKRLKTPTITMTFTNVLTGKSTVVRKDVGGLLKFLLRKKFDVDHIDVKNVNVYLIDNVKRMEGVDIGKFTYYKEHVFSVADYLVSEGVYEMISHKNESFYINRGKSYFGVNRRDEEKLMRNDNVVVIIGDIKFTVFHK